MKYIGQSRGHRSDLPHMYTGIDSCFQSNPRYKLLNNRCLDIRAYKYKFRSPGHMTLCCNTCISYHNCLPSYRPCICSYNSHQTTWGHRNTPRSLPHTRSCALGHIHISGHTFYQRSISCTGFHTSGLHNPDDTDTRRFLGYSTHHSDNHISGCSCNHSNQRYRVFHNADR